jgi:hypothetical protein
VSNTDVTASAPPPIPPSDDAPPGRRRRFEDDDDDDDDDDLDDLDVRNRRGRPQAINGLAMTSMILGVVGVSSCFMLICCCSLLGAGIIGVITGILAVIFGLFGRVPGSESYALTGMICGGVAAVLGIVEIVLWGTIVAHLGIFGGF